MAIQMGLSTSDRMTMMAIQMGRRRSEVLVTEWLIVGGWEVLMTSLFLQLWLGIIRWIHQLVKCGSH